MARWNWRVDHMKTHADALLQFLLLCSAPRRRDYRQALPGYRYQFPRDHFEHPDFRTEWWYYTGNVHARDGHRYGFELVFFRQGEQQGRPRQPFRLAHRRSVPGAPGAHRYRRPALPLLTSASTAPGPGIAGARAAQARVWNGNWEARWDPATGAQTLTAVAEGVRFTLRLDAAQRRR